MKYKRYQVYKFKQRLPVAPYAMVDFRNVTVINWPQDKPPDSDKNFLDVLIEFFRHMRHLADVTGDDSLRDTIVKP